MHAVEQIDTTLLGDLKSLAQLADEDDQHTPGSADQKINERCQRVHTDVFFCKRSIVDNIEAHEHPKRAI